MNKFAASSLIFLFFFVVVDRCLGDNMGVDGTLQAGQNPQDPTIENPQNPLGNQGPQDPTIDNSQNPFGNDNTDDWGEEDNKLCQGDSDCDANAICYKQRCFTRI
ncbi:hypothetical protein FO519_010027, partial [Halicephalobus sp. NKZ332]